MRADRSQQSRIPALLVAGALFMEALDGTIISNALPHVAVSFGVSPLDLNIGITAYLVAVGIGIPVSGWAARRFGGRRLFTAAMLLFTLASLGCAISTTLAAFIAARIVQGLAAAMMTPVGRILILRETPKTELVHVMALLTWPALLAPAIGPPLGGLIVQTLSWPWIFLLNLPIGLVAAPLAWRWLPDDPPAAAVLDRRGWLLWAVACGLLVVLVGQGARLSIGMLLAGALGCAAATVAAFRHLRRTRAPLLDLSTLKTASFAHAIIGGSLVRMAILANPFLLPLYLQVGLGFSPTHAGLLMLIGMIGNIAIKFATTSILRAFPFRTIVLVNGSLLAAGFAGFALIGLTTPIAALIALLVGTGFARSVHFTALNTLAFTDIAAPTIPEASTFSSAVLQLNAALGVAVASLAVELSAMVSGRSGGAVLQDYKVGFVVIALACLAGSLDAVRLRPDARALFALKGPSV